MGTTGRRRVRGACSCGLLGFACAALLPGASAAARNFVTPRPWGGFEFDMSDRDLQSAGSARGLAVDPTGRSVVAIGQPTDATRTYAYRFDPAGRQRARFRIDDGAVAVDARRIVYVASPRGTVTGYGPDGKRRQRFPVAGRPASIAVDRAGHVFVASTAGVRRYSRTGGAGRVFGRAGLLRAPRGIAVDDRGDVYVADAGAGQVVDFSASGRVRRRLRAPHPWSLIRPTGVGVDRAGHVVVAEGALYPNNPQYLRNGTHLMRFDRDGRFEAPIDAGFDATLLGFAPILLAVAPQGDVYFADNPDLEKLPAGDVAAPRFQIEDAPRQNDRRELAAVAVGAGTAYAVRVRVFRSLSRSLRVHVATGPGAVLVSGPADERVRSPLGRQPTERTWLVRPNVLGRHEIVVTASGVGPDGNRTELSKRLPLYATGTATVRILGAGYVAAKRKVVVGARLDFGFPVPEDEATDFDQATNSGVLIAARRSGMTLDSGGYFITTRTASCQSFPVAGGQLSDPVDVHASYDGYQGSRPATATATVRPTAPASDPSVAECVRIERGLTAR